MKLENRQTILFIGDSITDCHRNREKTDFFGLGNGYVKLLNSYFWSKYPQLRINVKNKGISGNRIIDLKERWNEDVLEIKPDWLSIMIGINDVWYQFSNLNDKVQINQNLFESVYSELIKKTLEITKNIILISPYFLEKNNEDPMKKMMNEYGKIVKKLAKEFDLIFVDSQKAFDEYLRHNPTQTLCDDRVHPNQIGHMIIANAILEKLK